MVNIIVFNCDDRYVEYVWDSKEDFVKDMESNNENIPMLDDKIVEVNTEDNTLQSWYKNRGEITVDVFLEKCKDLYKEN